MTHWRESNQIRQLYFFVLLGKCKLSIMTQDCVCWLSCIFLYQVGKYSVFLCSLMQFTRQAKSQNFNLCWDIIQKATCSFHIPSSIWHCLNIQFAFIIYYLPDYANKEISTAHFMATMFPRNKTAIKVSRIIPQYCESVRIKQFSICKTKSALDNIKQMISVSSSFYESKFSTIYDDLWFPWFIEIVAKKTQTLC